MDANYQAALQPILEGLQEGFNKHEVLGPIVETQIFDRRIAPCFQLSFKYLNLSGPRSTISADSG
jgi:hypothetical protein